MAGSVTDEVKLNCGRGQVTQPFINVVFIFYEELPQILVLVLLAIAMAISRSFSTAIVFLAVVSSLAVSALGRPCGAIFISYTFQSDSTVPISRSATDGRQISADRPRSITYFRVIPLRFYYRRSRVDPVESEVFEEIQQPRRFIESAVDVSSLRERTRDILVVVAALVFGVGCGALTSAIIYLAWYLISNRSEVSGSKGYGRFDDADEEIESPKKMGYTDLPAAPDTPVAPLNEGLGRN
ncbi:uncharacterized protein LOC144714830 [Wolffia australiana]